MKTTATVKGEVEFRAGDGPLLKVPEGPCDVDLADDSAVLSWSDDGEPMTAAIPRVEFDRFVKDGKIVLG